VYCGDGLGESYPCQGKVLGKQRVMVLGKVTLVRVKVLGKQSYPCQGKVLGKQFLSLPGSGAKKINTSFLKTIISFGAMMLIDSLVNEC
jgi:hypothetical protein